MRQYFGSALFSVVAVGFIALFAPVIVLLFLAPYHWRYGVARTWSRLNLRLAEVVCGMHYTVEGTEHIPEGACIIFSKHQSAWETLALQMIFPPQVWVLKRELMWIPLFGWALGLLEPIAINRSAGHRAVQSIVEQGRKRLQAWRVLGLGNARQPALERAYAEFLVRCAARQHDRIATLAESHRARGGFVFVGDAGILPFIESSRLGEEFPHAIRRVAEPELAMCRGAIRWLESRNEKPRLNPLPSYRIAADPFNAFGG